MKYMECTYCSEIALPVEGGECEECNRESFFNLGEDTRPKDDRTMDYPVLQRPRRVVAVLRPKENWYARWMR